MDYTQLPLANELIKSVREKTKKSVVRIYATGSEKNPKNELIGEIVGTGLIIGIDSRIFLVTARHLLNDFQNQKIRKFAFSTKRIGRPLQLFKNQINLKHSKKHDDVAIVELNSLQIKEIRNDNEVIPLKLENICPNYSVIAKYHVAITGFPSELALIDESKREIGSRELTYVGLLSEASPKKRIHHKSDRHFFIDYKPSENMDSSGNKIASPSPIGVSGGPVWCLINQKNPNGLWTSADIKVIGICHTWYDDFEIEKIHATKINVVLELAMKQWPNLTSFLNAFLSQS